MNNKKIFWIFQFAFWTIYYLYNIFVVHASSFFRGETNAIILLLYLFLLCFFGIPLGLLAKIVYEKIDYHSISLPVLILSIFLVSFILAHLWFFEIIVLDKIFNEIMARIGVGSATFIPLKLRVYLWEIFFSALLMVAWISIYLFFTFWQQWYRQQFEIEKAGLQLENAQLKMLRSQISPHFLFNSLSSLRALIRSNPKKAEYMLSQISDFLRYSLLTKQEHIVSLREELTAVKNYLAIEKIRFEDKLRVTFDIEPAAEDLTVPSFILHPLVENAVKHGMNTSTMPLSIIIKASIVKKNLIIEMTNSGAWNNDHQKINGTKTGLQNVKDRLKTIYPNSHSFHILLLSDSVKTVLEIKSEKN